MEKLYIKHSTEDYTEELGDFLEEVQLLSITPSEPLYFGKEKPFNNIYLKYDVPLLSKISFNIEYFNGTTWVSVLNLNDDTKRQTRSGFISWQEADDNTKIEKTTVGSVETFWYRLVPESQSDVTLKAVGVLFSQDRDLFQARPALDNSDYRMAVVGSDVDYDRVHLEVRQRIVQDIRNEGIRKYQSENDPDRLKVFRTITEWDLFDINEIREAAKNLALSNIYYTLSDAPQDKWDQEAKRFNTLYLKNFDLAWLSIDKNNDGKLQEFENIKRTKQSRMSR